MEENLVFIFPNEEDYNKLKEDLQYQIDSLKLRVERVEEKSK